MRRWFVLFLCVGMMLAGELQVFKKEASPEQKVFLLLGGIKVMSPAASTLRRLLQVGTTQSPKAIFGLLQTSTNTAFLKIIVESMAT